MTVFNAGAALSDPELARRAKAITYNLRTLGTSLTEVIDSVGCLGAVQELIDGAPQMTLPDTISPGALGEVRSSITTLAVMYHWAQSRYVYAMHPEMVNELGDCGDSELPRWVFDQLPNSDPFVVFPQPLPTTTSEGEPAEVLGFVVYGHPQGGGVCSTHNDNRGDLGLMFLVAVNGRDSTVPVGSLDCDVIRVTIPLSQETFTVNGAAAQTMQRFYTRKWERQYRDQAEHWVGELIGLAVNTLLYVCTVDADIEKVPVPPLRRSAKGKRTGKTTARRADKVVKVGWRLGPALGKARRRAAETRTTSPGSGRRQQPHQRKAHFRMCRVGKGRQESVIKFIRPYWVSLDLVDPNDDEITVVPVRPPRKRTG